MLIAFSESFIWMFYICWAWIAFKAAVVLAAFAVAFYYLGRRQGRR